MPFARPCFKRFYHARRALPDPARRYDAERTVGFHYGRECGVLLEDVDELQLLLLSLLDGRHSYPEIVALLQARDSTVTVEEVNEALDELIRFGLLEDASIQPPADFLPAYLKRYESQLRFLSLLDQAGTQKYALQARLKGARVAVLGLGGLGCNVLQGLAAMGIGFLRGVDFDRVERGNLNRQVLYDVADIGRPKVLAAAEQLARFNPDVQFEPVQREITGPQAIMDLVQGVDLVAFCADQPPEIALWMNQASLATGLPFIVGGYHGVTAEVGPLVHPFQTGCLACSDVGIVEHAKSDIAELAWMGEESWIRHPTIHFVTALTANLLCSDLCKYIIGVGQPATWNHRYALDIEQFTLTATALERSPTCKACGQVHPKTAGP